MCKKILLNMLSALALLLALPTCTMDVDEPKSSVTLPVEMYIETALQKQNPEEASQVIRQMQGVNRQSRIAIDRATEQIINKMAKSYDIPKPLAALYIGTKPALAWLDKWLMKGEHLLDENVENAMLKKFLYYYIDSKQDRNLSKNWLINRAWNAPRHIPNYYFDNSPEALNTFWANSDGNAQSNNRTVIKINKGLEPIPNSDQIMLPMSLVDPTRVFLPAFEYPDAVIAFGEVQDEPTKKPYKIIIKYTPEGKFKQFYLIPFTAN